MWGKGEPQKPNVRPTNYEKQYTKYQSQGIFAERQKWGTFYFGTVGHMPWVHSFQAPYWCYYHVPDLSPQCRLFPGRTWCRLHTSWVMGRAHRQTLGGHTYSVKKHESFPWTVQNDSLQKTDEQLRSSPQSWRERRPERGKTEQWRLWKEEEIEEG